MEAFDCVIVSVEITVTLLCFSADHSRSPSLPLLSFSATDRMYLSLPLYPSSGFMMWMYVADTPGGRRGEGEGTVVKGS